MPATLSLTKLSRSDRAERVSGQIAELMVRRFELHAEMVTSHAGTDSTWFRDRANEMEHLNKSLDRLRVMHAALAGE